MTRDVMTELSQDNPAPEATIARLDRRHLDSIRTATLAVQPTPSSARGGRWLRLTPRGVVAGSLALALAGGGVAYAAARQGWFATGGGAADGLSCVSEWADPTTTVLESTGGPWLTGDPIADCQRYQQLNDLPLLEDPVAFRYGTPQVYVAPRNQVPADADVLASGIEDAAVFELYQSVWDTVSGLGAQCYDAAEAPIAAQAELDRLGLADWTVQVEQRPADKQAGPCAAIRFAVDPIVEGGMAQGPGVTTLVVTPDSHDDRTDLSGAERWVTQLRDALETQVSDGCVALDQAEAIALVALGEHSAPVTPIVDNAASCSRAYLLPGGNAEITLYGPRSSQP